MVRARGVFCRNVKKYTRILHFSELGGLSGLAGIKVYAGAGQSPEKVRSPRCVDFLVCSFGIDSKL